MESDQNETLSPIEAVGSVLTPTHKHASSLSTSTATPSPTFADRRQRSSSNPSDGASVKHSAEHDSFTTVRLSEPPARQLTLNTNVSTHGTIQDRRSLFGNTLSPQSASISPGPSPLSARFSRIDPNECLSPVTSIPSSSLRPNLQDELEGLDDDSKTISGVEAEDSDEEEVDWETLQSKEDAESNLNEEDTTAMLLARLEQENDRLATNPKTVKVKAVERIQQTTRKIRPPSMVQLRHMVQGPQPAPLRYSMLPPPPMTDLEFYAALVKDYQQTAARLPTLLANKIRKGIPPPLRGVVWQSMSGARDATLEDAFERYTGESSPYEGIIGKDLGRSFPGVDMFRDPEGDGQRALGRVLKCYSIYDPKVGYCQGLALLVGPLLMHMTDKQAFCVLVKLMEQYDLRSSFTPDLYGLQVKFYQFRELLRDNLPALSAHLDDLQVDPAAYVSQWFLSFFAVTCPLPMLFRVYDVIFAEGASETIMRVALSLMSKNMGRILALQEMEDVLQLLLSRSLWGAYNQNADEFVSDFVSLSPVVNKERLAALEQGYRESQLTSQPPATGSINAGGSEVTSAASRFLGRLWANSTTSLKAPPNNHNSNLTPSAASRPLSMLKRSASKQSLASTLNSMEASTNSTSSAASVLSTASTDATSFTRDSAAESALGRESKVALQNHNADSQQIEDLLIALSDLQRQHALLADELQREREERDEDRRAVKHLLGGIRRQASSETIITAHSGDSDATIKPEGIDNASVTDLLDMMEGRFGEDENKRRSSIAQTKPQLRDDLARTKEQLAIEMSKTQDANRRAVDLEQEIANIKDQLRESHAHVRNLHTEKQRLEKQIRTMRVRASDSTGNDSAAAGNGWLSRNPSTKSNAPGLRELKLGRSQSTPSGILTVNKRTSSLQGANGGDTPPPPPLPTSEAQAPPAHEHEALLLELVQAKTAEAVARQEADEAKQKLEQLRKSLGLSPEHSSASLTPGQPGVMGMLRSFTSPAAELAAAAAKPAAPVKPAATTTPTPAPATGGGFWGWGKK
ncbi:hypothetical protein N0V93_009928 [Gnomoniopsis smithogilvyi]|uniref:Rab-GAP TBC domain-containing protein n=1 Tax=Gnomoniopsis smithogilvyi TaxID=1191159 RepID=A0A9W8YI95_9PEZI|nr:hypothetical protein N0V93_009928 [Gnomoniopsis smithogilvyi]